MAARYALKRTVLGALLALGTVSGALAQQTSEAFLSEAENAVRRGDSVAAIQLFQSAIIFAPTAPDAYNRLAEYYASIDQPDMAEKYFGIALNVDPANPPALKGLALLALASGDVAGARARHDLLMRACGPACPEAAQVGAALNTGTANPGAANGR